MCSEKVIASEVMSSVLLCNRLRNGFVKFKNTADKISRGGLNFLFLARVCVSFFINWATS